jgi:hypothetical protein
MLLKDLFDNRIAEANLSALVGDVVVSSLPPDRVPIGAEERAQLNLSLYRITPNSRWQQTSSGNGAALSDHRPALALDLCYLIAAYGEQEFQAHILLGHAVQVLHEIPRLDGTMIREVLSSIAASSSAMHSALANSGLADHVHSLTLQPEFQSAEESSRLWSSLQAPYRPSVAWRVSTVLIEGRR